MRTWEDALNPCGHADELGVCLRTYQYWESGFTRPGTTDQLERLSRSLSERTGQTSA